MAFSAAAQTRESKYLKLEKPRDYTLTITMDVRLMKSWDPNFKVNRRSETLMKFDSASIIFPVLPDTGSSRAKPSGSFTGTVSWNEKVATDKVTIIRDPKYGGTHLAKWELRESEGTRLELEIVSIRTCHNTVFDEAAALKVPWPKGEWHAEAASALQPQMYVDMGPDETGVFAPYDMEPVNKLVDKWVKGKDPKSVMPVALAKWFAGQVVEHVQPTGTTRATGPEGDFEGVAVQGAAVTAKSRRGNDADIACLLAAVYRRAGLPARIVIGWDTGQEDKDRFLEKNKDKGMRFWVEFALFDEAANTLDWIPVDVNAIREKSSRLPDDFMPEPQKYFGTHDQLAAVIPFAFHFHPPTTVRAYGSPGFWGWLVFPEPPGNVVQGFRFRSQTTPQVGADDKQSQGNTPAPRGRR